MSLTPPTAESKTQVVARLILLCLVALLGCRRGSGDGPPCAAVGAKFLALAHQELQSSTASEAMRRAVTDQLPAIRDSLTQACSDTQWTAAVRTCLVGAADHLAFAACEQQLTEPQRRALDRATRGEPD